jgi:hypothetical protein
MAEQPDSSLVSMALGVFCNLWAGCGLGARGALCHVVCGQGVRAAEYCTLERALRRAWLVGVSWLGWHACDAAVPLCRCAVWSLSTSRRVCLRTRVLREQ